jgi:hypothetical protein
MVRPDGVLKIVGFFFGGVGILLASISAWLLTDAWTFNVLPGVFGVLGAIFVLVASLVLILPALGKRRRRLALTTGISVQAKVTQVRIISFKVNGRHPWIIVVEHQDEDLGRKLTFTSEHLWTDPTSYYPVNSTVTVFYLPQKPSIHAFVLDKIPETA